MLTNITNALQQVATQPVGLLFALLLGLVSTATSTCCTIPAIGVIVGYSGSRAEHSRKDAVKAAIFFTVGTIISLMIVGGIAGFAGQAAQAALGQYWKLFAGIIAVVIGLATLKMLPVKLSFAWIGKFQENAGKSGTILAGLILGGIVAVSSLPCNPGIFIVIGAAILQGNVLWAMSLLAMFAIGFSIPMGAIMLGISLSKFSLAAKGMDAGIRWIAGSILIAAGFYFMLTFA